MSWASKTNPAPLPGIGARGARERQSVWCCGLNYSRWRFIGREFPGTHMEKCCRCEKRLRWPAPNNTLKLRFQPMDAGEKREANRRNSLARYHRRAQEFIRLGLTSHGTRRKRRPSISPLELAWRASGLGISTINHQPSTNE